MTDLVSLLFIAMIPIDFKITNFSLHLYIFRLYNYSFEGLLYHIYSHLDMFTPVLKLLLTQVSQNTVYTIYSICKYFCTLFNILVSLSDARSISPSLGGSLITFYHFPYIRDPQLPINYFCGHLTLRRLRTLVLPF